MKLIIPIIREVQLDYVREALIKAEITRITVSCASGHGQQRMEEMYRGQKVVPNLIPKIKLEVAVNDNFANSRLTYSISLRLLFKPKLALINPSSHETP